MGLVFRMGLGGDFGAEPPQSEGSGGKAFCGTKRFLWHKNTPCPAFGPYAKRQLNSSTFNSAAKL